MSELVSILRTRDQTIRDKDDSLAEVRNLLSIDDNAIPSSLTLSGEMLQELKIKLTHGGWGKPTGVLGQKPDHVIMDERLEMSNPSDQLDKWRLGAEIIQKSDDEEDEKIEDLLTEVYDPLHDFIAYMRERLTNTREERNQWRDRYHYRNGETNGLRARIKELKEQIFEKVYGYPKIKITHKMTADADAVELDPYDVSKQIDDSYHFQKRVENYLRANVPQGYKVTRLEDEFIVERDDNEI